MNKLKSICVFCGSNNGNDPAVAKAASELGMLFARRGITMIYGAGKIGVMGSIAESALENGGKVVGVIPEFLKLKEVVHLGLTELVTTENMHQRKMKMQEVSDGFIALPGGMGTLEELFEIVTWLQLGLHQKPIGVLNVNGFYDPLIVLLENMVEKGFISSNNYNLLLIDDNLDGLLQKMENFKRPSVTKWLNKQRT